ncbi:glycosyltransferase family 4 protein [Pseudotenacibaculum haliotis]|uniref:Glycosyltransferase family 4 protein n=1 Tax=Pseudotenacibaculum haliotis TaxID=1862138 RepID=A0ABW5LPS3_9FLAO
MSIKEPLKIFVDAYLLNKEHQGTRTYIKELYKEFSKRNEKANIYIGCFKNAEIVREFGECKNVHFVYYKQKNRFLRMLTEIPRIIKSYKFDYAHFQYVIPFKRNRSTKYIVTIHDILFNDFKDQFSSGYRLKRNFLFRYSAKKSDFLCTVSRYSEERLKNIYELGQKKIYITPNGVKRDYFTAFDKKEEQGYIERKYGVKNYLLYVSRIEPRKNQQALIDHFSHLESNISLVFIGEKTQTAKKLEQKLAALNEETRKRVHFFSDLSEKDLISFLRAAKLFVYPSLAEGFGIPPLEAAATRIPVLCSNATAMEDFHFFEPYHIDFHQEEQIGDKIKEILSKTDADRLQYISSIVKEKYSWAKACETLEMIIKDG